MDSIKNHCENCVYRVKVYDSLYCCGYILKTGKMRGCDPGEGCTKKVSSRVYRRKKRKNG